MPCVGYHTHLVVPSSSGALVCEFMLKLVVVCFVITCAEVSMMYQLDLVFVSPWLSWNAFYFCTVTSSVWLAYSFRAFSVFCCRSGFSVLWCRKLCSFCFVIRALGCVLCLFISVVA